MAYPEGEHHKTCEFRWKMDYSNKKYGPVRVGLQQKCVFPNNSYMWCDIENAEDGAEVVGVLQDT